MDTAEVLFFLLKKMIGGYSSPQLDEKFAEAHISVLDPHCRSCPNLKTLG